MSFVCSEGHYISPSLPVQAGVYSYGPAISLLTDGDSKRTPFPYWVISDQQHLFTAQILYIKELVLDKRKGKMSSYKNLPS